jgi:hypothetical protein
MRRRAPELVWILILACQGLSCSGASHHHIDQTATSSDFAKVNAPKVSNTEKLSFADGRDAEAETVTDNSTKKGKQCDK